MIDNCPPVLMVGFNRPDFLKQVFAQVREAKPSQLFLALDHPREGREDDVEGWTRCKEIYEGVDWPCEVHRNYAEKNMGCRRRIESAISWAVENEDRVIILEDDCVPCQDFFRFCGELLEKYKDDSRVGMICGHDEHSHVAELDVGGAGYYFDRFTSIWGWATWRRAWQLHDPSLSYWPAMKESPAMRDFFVEKESVDLWKIHFEGVYTRKVDTWDTGLLLTAIKQNWLSIHPCAKLIKNIGSGFSSRTDAKAGKKASWVDNPYGKVAWPLVHPLTMLPSAESEKFAREMHLLIQGPRFKRKLAKFARRILVLAGLKKSK